MIVVNMAKAREIHRERMRQARAPKLATLDTEFLRAQETNVSTKAIAEKKQALRDVTKHPAIDAAKTPEELKAVWPDVLN